MLESAKNIRAELHKKPEIKELERKIVTEMLQIRKHDIVEYLEKSGLVSVKTRRKLEGKYLSH